MNEMTGAEFRILREHLGLTNAWLADHLDVAERSIVRWGDGASPIPVGVAEEMLELEAAAADQVARHCDWLRDMAPERRQLITYRTDDVHHLINPADPYPASWHRACAARVRERVDGVRVVFAPEG